MKNLDVVNKWKELALNDLLAADQLDNGGNLLLSAFHLQQCLEKYLKACFIFNKSEQPPYIHNLTQLAKICELDKKLKSEYIDLLDELNPFYIKARYPTFKKDIASALSKQKVENLIRRTKDFVTWLEQELK